MGDPVEVDQKKKLFTFEEANRVLPSVKKMTVEAIEQAGSLILQIESLSQEDERRANLDDELNAIVDKWVEKVQRLGARPKGLWLIDFDNGEGYYCWKHPESHIQHVHTYEGDFTTRQKIN
ncbi:MAG: DUF2203 family protein [Deltaproteobacteria bacterium]|nr:DUF2203 family protein [Deltaproteobacteria bacterium]